MATEENTFWDAETYERIGRPMREWAKAVIDDLDLQGDETVLDAGCGSGSVTLDLLERLPQGKIYALDSSEEMISKVTNEIKKRGANNVIPVLASLTNFELPEQVDAVFSNAVFHWISDDAGLFGSLLRATKAGGLLRAQCGGAGNIPSVLAAAHAVQTREPYAEHIAGVHESTTFRTPAEVTAALERNGWSDVRVSLFEAPAHFDSHDEAALYLRTIVLRDYVEKLPDALAEGFLHDVIAECERTSGRPFEVDYVRLDMWARRQD